MIGEIDAKLISDFSLAVKEAGVAVNIMFVPDDVRERGPTFLVEMRHDHLVFFGVDASLTLAWHKAFVGLRDYVTMRECIFNGYVRLMIMAGIGRLLDAGNKVYAGAPGAYDRHDL